eukprot:CAMPEP_0185794516 /NCGR_PEP_ID=MMETSP1174-20130828/160055_1 /TAXON_ID=35687 /ORGANISM="Dictyocha speculum, Strain CCMP1381" /LENGTH=169 /DNA_ID=CAMNT_0028489749 /DNA_START=611 /DNA_END=1120 /DNA_ORIENTATION=+
MGSFVESMLAMRQGDEGLDHDHCGYVAQHLILDQIPHLLSDIGVPDLVCVGEGLQKHFFFGPEGTVTPLHHDPFENYFIQAVGSKYIRLYAPDQSHALQPISSGALTNNTSLPRDILTADPSTLPESFLATPYVEAVLGPGDALFLPKGWWHFVKSRSISISVAFHFTT